MEFTKYELEQKMQLEIIVHSSHIVIVDLTAPNIPVPNTDSPTNNNKPLWI